MYFDLLLLIVGILGSFFFAGAETGFVSLTPVKFKHVLSGNKTYGKILLNRGRVVATLLVGNNICIVLATLAFNDIAEPIIKNAPVFLQRIPPPETWFLSPVLVIFAELLPKSLFRIYPVKLTVRSFPILYFFAVLFSPVTLLFKPFYHGKEGSVKKNLENSMLHIVREGREKGVVADSFAERIIESKNRRISDMPIGISFSDLKKLVSRGYDFSEFGINRFIFSDDGSTLIGYEKIEDVHPSQNSEDFIISDFKHYGTHDNFICFLVDVLADTENYVYAIDDGDGFVKEVIFRNSLFTSFFSFG